VLVYGSPVSALAARAAAERVAARALGGWSDDDVVVAIVANLRDQKDYPTLFDAAAIALAREPRLRFVSAGQGPLEEQLRADLATRDLGDRFVMLGYHPDPPAVLAGADIFTLSSIHEGLPISLIEAMAMGVPPVVTSVGGNPEVVVDGRDGIVVPPRRPDLLADAYVALARDGTRRAAMSAAAATRAHDFDIVRTARLVEARYRELVDARHR
jgi:glycosyltransferase involved in cell wall biosynthesis